MLETALVALEHSLLATALRQSTWVYPLVNAGHVAGLGLLIGSIVPLDLRLLGHGRLLPLDGLWHLLGRVAMAGLGLAIVCGALLFITDAVAYAQSSLFRAKMALLGVGIANALLARRARPRGAATPIGRRLRVHAIVSLAVWPAVLLLGRLIGYF